MVVVCSQWFFIIVMGSQWGSRRFSVVLVDSQWFSVVLPVGSRSFSNGSCMISMVLSGSLSGSLLFSLVLVGSQCFS